MGYYLNIDIMVVLLVGFGILWGLGNLDLKPEHRRKPLMYLRSFYTFQDIVTKRGKTLKTIAVILLILWMLVALFVPTTPYN